MDQIWCVPVDCMPFLAAATSWDQLYVNLGNKFLSDTADRVLTQIRDLIELDEIEKWRSRIISLVERTLAFTPSINQDLLVATVAEKIFYDYQSIKRNRNETYEQGIDEVYNQYKTTISSRAASGDMPDDCVKEIICCMEQFKNRLLARRRKATKREHLIDQIIQLNQKYFQEKQINPRKLDEIKDESERLLHYLSRHPEFNQFNTDEKSDFLQANFEKLIMRKYHNDPQIEAILHQTRAYTLPIIRNQIEGELSNIKLSVRFTDCPDYDPYRNYAKFKSKQMSSKRTDFV